MRRGQPGTRYCSADDSAAAKAGCRCHADPPRLHGPYHQWTRKIAGKTVTRILTDDQLADYQPWFDNQRRLRALVAELETLSQEIAGNDPRGNR